LEEGLVGRRGYPPEFRRKVLDLVESGRSVTDVTRDMGTAPSRSTPGAVRTGSAKGSFLPGEKPELTAAKRGIAELEAELAVSTTDEK
jgi:transposase